MEIRVLRYFLTVVREESITKASEVLHITQPTLSRQLSRMEEEIGVKLFHRGTKKNACIAFPYANPFPGAEFSLRDRGM